jgi:hypothetical protein
MYLRLPFHASTSVQQTVLVLNTVLLIAILIIVELVYSERGQTERKHLKYFLPIVLVLVGLLVYAATKQAVSS